MNRTLVQSLLFAAALSLLIAAPSNAAEKSCCDTKKAESAAAPAEEHVHGELAPAPESQATAKEAKDCCAKPDEKAVGPLATKLAEVKMECCEKDGAETVAAKPAMMDCCKTDGAATAGSKFDLMADARTLLRNHKSITRAVTPLSNGVRTVTTTSDPNLLDILRRHPLEMSDYFTKGGVVRGRDPLFAELSRVADKIHIEFKEIENGIETVSTSDDTAVAKLILRHAAKVSEFVLRGVEAMHEFGTGADNDAQPQAPESPAILPQEHVH